MKREIRNPYIDIFARDDYKCFGCSPHNDEGLQMKFTDLGDRVECMWKPKTQFEGFSKILHGGIQATLQDEIASWYIFAKCGTSGVTQSMNIRFLYPVHVGEKEIRITATQQSIEEKLATLKTQLFDADNKLCSEAEIVYFLFSEAVAKRKHNYPGTEKFFDE